MFCYFFWSLRNITHLIVAVRLPKALSHHSAGSNLPARVMLKPVSWCCYKANTWLLNEIKHKCLNEYLANRINTGRGKAVSKHRGGHVIEEIENHLKSKYRPEFTWKCFGLNLHWNVETRRKSRFGRKWNPWFQLKSDCIILFVLMFGIKMNKCLKYYPRWKRHHHLLTTQIRKRSLILLYVIV